MRRSLNVLTIVLAMLLMISGPVSATEMPKTDTSGASPINDYLKQEGIDNVKKNNKKESDVQIQISQAKNYTIPGNKGTLTSNAWRDTFSTQSGNTLQWDYQVSAVYSGTYTVERIRTSWQGSASLRNSASISLGLGDSVSAGSSSSWSYTNTVVKYYENTKGQKISDYGSNMYVTPASDYREFTISIANTALVVLNGDPKPYQITASV